VPANAKSTLGSASYRGRPCAADVCVDQFLHWSLSSPGQFRKVFKLLSSRRPKIYATFFERTGAACCRAGSRKIRPGFFYTSGTTGQPKGSRSCRTEPHALHTVLHHVWLIVLYITHTTPTNTTTLDERGHQTCMQARYLTPLNSMLCLISRAAVTRSILECVASNRRGYSFALEQYETFTLFCVPTMVSRLSAPLRLGANSTVGT